MRCDWCGKLNYTCGHCGTYTCGDRCVRCNSPRPDLDESPEERAAQKRARDEAQADYDRLQEESA